MDISSLGGGNGLDLQSIQEMMRGKKGMVGTEEALAGSAVQQAAAAASLESSGGVMSRNFVSAPQSEETSYAQKTLAGKQAVSAQTARQNAVLNTTMAQMENMDSYAARTLAGKRAARNMMQEMQRTVQEESARNLKENQNAIEAAAEGAKTQGSAATAPAAASDATAAAAVAAASAAAPVAASTPPEAPTPDSASAAPSAPSVDVTV